MSKWLNYSMQWLNKAVPAAPLVMFRVLFGFLMAFNTVRFWYFGWIEDHFIEPQFHFKYYGFSWIEPLGLEWMYAFHILAFIASIGIMLGLFYRLSALLFFILFTYFELIDLTYYLNHYYFISLMSLLLVFMPLNKSFSLDVYFNRVSLSSSFPNWVNVLIKFQIAVVYIYAGIAKINSDWLLNALPLRIWLPANSDMPILGWLFNYPITSYVFSWAGMLFDTFIVFFLLNKRTRPFAYIILVFFHAVTAWLFQIGVFPLVMSVIVLVFFSPNFHERIIRFIHSILPIKKHKQHPQSDGVTSKVNHLGLAVLVIYAAFQLLFPWRFLAYPGNMYWTEEGYRFGWRVMLVEKAGTAQFYVINPKTGVEGAVFNREFLNATQEKQMSFQPDLMLQFAHYLKETYEAQGIENPKVRCEAYVTLNGRPGQLLFDPTLDLTTIKDTFAPKSWIYPLKHD